MTKKEILDYVMENPGNTNVSVLGPMVDAVAGITPSGKIEITENGTDIDVAQYAKADVNVTSGEQWNKTITFINNSVNGYFLYYYQQDTRQIGTTLLPANGGELVVTTVGYTSNSNYCPNGIFFLQASANLKFAITSGSSTKYGTLFSTGVVTLNADGTTKKGYAIIIASKYNGLAQNSCTITITDQN